MAEVTGFTSQRMKQIEDTTVVDGEVQGDNLILLQRNGTPIDAGNVRGPQGSVGPPGGVTHVNDQLGDVYTPRVFANKAALDAWAPPNGVVGLTQDSESAYLRVDGAWVVNNSIRVYATKAALDAGWAAAGVPEGSFAATLADRSLWMKDASGWRPSTPTRIYSSSADINSAWPAPAAFSQAILTDSQTEMFWTPHGTPGWVPNMGIRIFSSAAERDARWPNPPEGAMCQVTAGIFNCRIGGKWLPWPQHVKSVEQHVTGAYIDQDWSIAYNDNSGVWPVESVAEITVNAAATGWQVGIYPGGDLYSNDIGYPWGSGIGYGYDIVKAPNPFSQGNIGGGGAIPMTIGTFNGIQHLPAGYGGITWTLRLSIHPGAGAIAVNGGFHAIMKRTPRIPKSTS